MLQVQSCCAEKLLCPNFCTFPSRTAWPVLSSPSGKVAEISTSRIQMKRIWLIIWCQQCLHRIHGMLSSASECWLPGEWFDTVHPAIQPCIVSMKNQVCMVLTLPTLVRAWQRRQIILTKGIWVHPSIDRLDFNKAESVSLIQIWCISPKWMTM